MVAAGGIVSIVEGRYLHGLRRMGGRNSDESRRAATPLELLFDLTFVAAFSVAGQQLAHGIAAGYAAAAALSFVLAMSAVVWAWINVAWFASAFDTDDWLYRLLTMLQMAGVIVLAIGLPPLFASIERGGALDYRGIVAGYIVLRLAVLLQWVRAVRTNPRYRPVALVYGAFVGAAQAGWVLLAVLHPDAETGLVAILVLLTIEILGPVAAEHRGKRRGSPTPWHPHHLVERFALLTIIALGETVFGTLDSAADVAAAGGWSFDAVIVVAAGVALSFALWWTYFLVPHAAVLEVCRDKVIPWAYGHVVLFVAIAAIGAGLHSVGAVYAPGHHVSVMTAVAGMTIPAAVFMVVRFLLHAWLLSGPPRPVAIQIAVMALPPLAVGLAAAGTALWVCLLVVLASPVALIVSFELGGWRALDAQLAAARTYPKAVAPRRG
jgi:low temperature requirement protein LtrA